MYILIRQSLQLWEATNKKPERTERIIHQLLEKHSFRKLFHLKIFDRKSRIFRTASCRQFFIENK